MSVDRDDDALKRELLAMLSADAPAANRDPADVFRSSLVRLHARGNKRPFFCVHPGSGEAGCFAEAAGRVDPDRPFFALQAPGIDGECTPLEDLCALARGYVGEVRRAQPHGPYLLGGWSLGGMVALEMARELRQQGEEVALLAMFDTLRTDALHGVMSREAGTELLYRHHGLAAEHLARQRGVELDPEITYSRFKERKPRATVSRLDLMIEILVEHGVFRDARAPMFQVFRANVLALGDYGISDDAYDRTITLFRCRNEYLGPEFVKVADDYCWSKSTTRPVDVMWMRGHHFGLFHGDALAGTVEGLRRALDQADPS
jgi:thioesterase domain-containing protein